MLLLLLVSQLEINLYANKDTFLLGEDIFVRWEIVNNGKKVGYYERSAEHIKLTNDAFLWDFEGREVPHGVMSGSNITVGSTLPIDTIRPGDTVKFREQNLIGVFGSLRFAGMGFANKYLKPGNYFLSLFYYKGKDWSEKIYSDTLLFSVVEPAGLEKAAWELYKEFKAEQYRMRDDKVVEFGYKLLKEYSKSEYIEGTINDLSSSYRVLIKYEDSREKMAPTTRKINDYLEQNVEKFRGEERVLNETINCITHGELMLGTPKEEVRKKILKMNIPVTSDIKKTLDIKEEEIDTKKK